MSKPPIGVLALQGDVREHLRLLTSLGVPAVAVRRPDELDAVAGLVLPGGESTTMIRLARIFDLVEPLRSRIAEGMPAFGTCAGMILLADRVLDGIEGQETLGGLDITVRRNAFGRQVDSFEAEIDAPELGGRVRGVFIRAPRLASTGPAVEVLGRLGDAAVLVRQGRVLAATFHPEIAGDHRLHRLFIGLAA